MVKDIFANLNAAVANTMSNDIKMIDIDELHSSEDNFFEIERIEEFAETILGQGGVKENLIVTPLPTGGYEIISGHRRTAAVRYLLNKGEIVQRVLPCLVQNFKSDDDKMLNLVFMNVTARRLSDAELWTSYKTVDAILKKKKEAGEKFGKIREALAGYLGISAAQVGKLQNVDNNAISEVKEAVENGDISIFTANEIAKLNEDEQETIVAAEDLSNIKPKDIKKLNSEKVATSSNFPDISNSEKSATSSNFPDTSNSEKSATSSNFPDISNSEKSATSSNFPDTSNSEKSATYGNFTIRDTYIDLLDRITERYNAEVQANYHDGILDYIPKDKTSSEMLEIILCRYALENYEDLLRTSE